MVAEPGAERSAALGCIRPRRAGQRPAASGGAGAARPSASGIQPACRWGTSSWGVAPGSVPPPLQGMAPGRRKQEEDARRRRCNILSSCMLRIFISASLVRKTRSGMIVARREKTDSYLPISFLFRGFRAVRDFHQRLMCPEARPVHLRPVRPLLGYWEKEAKRGRGSGCAPRHSLGAAPLVPSLSLPKTTWLELSIYAHQRTTSAIPDPSLCHRARVAEDNEPSSPNRPP